MLKLITLLSTLFSLAFCLKFASITSLQQSDFYNQTGVLYDSSIGLLHSTQNIFAYFFIQGQSIDSTLLQDKTEFQSARYSYLKALHYAKLSKQQIQTEIIDQQRSVSTQKIDLSSAQQSQQKQYRIDFYLVKCSANIQTLNQIPSICTLLCQKGAKKSRLIFFTQNSELIQFTGNLKQESLIYFISKVKQNREPQTSRIVFDQELGKMAKQIEIQKVRFEQKALSFFQSFTRYLTWDALKFFTVFIIVPFAFGYVSTKMQQRANRKIIQKYQGNLQQEPTKSPSETKQYKPKSN